MRAHLTLLLMFATLLGGGCAERDDAGNAPAATPPRDTASEPSRASNTGGSVIVTRADGGTAWILRLDGSQVELGDADGERLIGDQRGDKRRYRRESDGSAAFEVKRGDNGFKLRAPDGRLLWKVRYGDDKFKISDNEENRGPWVVKTRYDDKAKVLDPAEREVGAVRFYDGRIKVKDTDGEERFAADTTRRSAAFGVLLMSAIPPQQQAILMLELLADER